MGVPLAALRPGQAGVVEGYAEDDERAHRLMHMGVVEGTAVEVVRFAPTGDPIEIRVMGYALSLRHDDAANVLMADVTGG